MIGQAFISYASLSGRTCSFQTCSKRPLSTAGLRSMRRHSSACWGVVLGLLCRLSAWRPKSRTKASKI